MVHVTEFLARTIAYYEQCLEPVGADPQYEATIGACLNCARYWQIVHADPRVSELATLRGLFIPKKAGNHWDEMVKLFDEWYGFIVSTVSTAGSNPASLGSNPCVPTNEV